MGPGSRAVYNLISIIFFLLAIVIAAVTAGWITETIEVPEALSPSTDVPHPTEAALLTWTPSHTPTITNTPTITPSSTATFTRTPTATQTPTDTSTPTITPTSTTTPTATPSSTYTLTFTPQPPTFTFTPSFTPSPTGPTATPTYTPAPFPFVVPPGTLRLRPDLNGSCAFQGFGGNVFDLIGEPITGLNIVVTGPGLPSTGAVALSGSNDAYGPGGWEVKVADAINTNTYTVQLQKADGTALSAPIQVAFSNDCDQNLVLIRFDQIRPY